MNRAVFCFFIVIQVVLFGAEPSRESAVCWDGEFFQEMNAHQTHHRRKGPREIQGTAIYFSAGHITCYGHALLDGVFPLYCMLKEKDLLEARVTLLVNADSYTRGNKTFLNILQMLKDVFKFKEIVILGKGDYVEKLIVDDHVPINSKKGNCFAYYRACPESFSYIHDLKNFGFVDNVIFKDPQGIPIVKEFVDFIKKAYQIDPPVIKNRILFTYRSFARKVVNQDQLLFSLRNAGYDVVVVDFERLPIKQQIIECAQSEYLLGTYGSNLVNAIFLQPQASVVVLWHKYAKYFWSRRYCVIHSAFLSAGVKLIEFDQPDYDFRNFYQEPIHVQDYFYRSRNMNMLKEEKINLDAIIAYPLPAMYELTNVDLYIEPVDLINCLKRAESF